MVQSSVPPARSWHRDCDFLEREGPGKLQRVRLCLTIGLGLYRDNGKENGNIYLELYWGSIGIMEKWTLLFRVISGLCWDNGKENGNNCIMIGYIMGF